LDERVRHVYVHLDVDVVDISEGSANSYACAGGLSLEELDRVLDLIGNLLPIAVGSVTSYDPEADSGGPIASAIPRMVELLAR
jgi:arginase